jgi:hypothetical protein
MAAQLATETDDRHETKRRNWFHLSRGWKRHPAWRTMTPAHRVVFYTILDIANEMWFPDSVQLYEAELADESATSTRTVKRALEELRDAGVLHFGTVEEDRDRRTAVRIRIDYDALTRLGSRRSAESGARNSAECRHDVEETQRPCGSPPPQVQLQKKQPDCPGGQLRVPEVGGGLREGDLCPKCQEHRLLIRFKTDAANRTKQRFLACSGYSAGGCRGFTWNLGSTGYEPSQRVLSQALVGARHVPGRPALVQETFAAAQRAEENAAPNASDRPTYLSEWLSMSRYLPEDLMLDSLDDVAPDLAAHHRSQGSDKHAILRDVRGRL